MVHSDVRRVQSTDETILKSKATSIFFTLQFLVYLYSDKPLQVTIYKGTFFYNKFYKKIISDIWLITTLLIIWNGQNSWIFIYSSRVVGGLK
jgi:hypothetical protein